MRPAAKQFVAALRRIRWPYAVVSLAALALWPALHRTVKADERAGSPLPLVYASPLEILLSPDETRGLVPGLAYQLGILIAAPTNSLELLLKDYVGYQWAIAGFEIVTIAVLIVTLLSGKERKGRSFQRAETLAST